MNELVQTGSKYSDEDRRQAVAYYCVLGVMSKVSQATDIPTTTLAHWKNKSDWWDGMVAEVRIEKEAEIQAQFSKIIEEACKSVLDSLENGDEVHTKDGIQRIKMKGRDAATVGAIMFDKLQLSLNRPTSIKGDTGSLEELAQKFRDLSSMYSLRNANSIPGDCEEID